MKTLYALTSQYMPLVFEEDPLLSTYLSLREIG